MELGGPDDFPLIYPYNPHTLKNNELPRLDRSSDDPLDLAPISSFPVDPDHPICANWDSVAEGIIANLNMVHLKYSSVECWRRRQESQRRHRHAAAAATDRDDHTILIRLEKLPLMTGRILNCLSNIYLLSGSLFLEIVEGRVEHRAGKSNSSGSAAADGTGTIELSMGASIGGGWSCSVTWIRRARQDRTCSQTVWVDVLACHLAAGGDGEPSRRDYSRR
ncbi:hypothetical protein V8E54_010893 [Elaphomyces granulatus]